LNYSKKIYTFTHYFLKILQILVYAIRQAFFPNVIFFSPYHDILMEYMGTFEQVNSTEKLV